METFPTRVNTYVSVETPEDMETFPNEIVAMAMALTLKLDPCCDRTTPCMPLEKKVLDGGEDDPLPRPTWRCTIARARDNYTHEYDYALALERNGRLESVRARLAEEGREFKLELCLHKLGLI